jgi:hypothetical protein
VNKLFCPHNWTLYRGSGIQPTPNFLFLHCMRRWSNSVHPPPSHIQFVYYFVTIGPYVTQVIPVQILISARRVCLYRHWTMSITEFGPRIHKFDSICPSWHWTCLEPVQSNPCIHIFTSNYYKFSMKFLHVNFCGYQLITVSHYVIGPLRKKNRGTHNIMHSIYRRIIMDDRSAQVFPYKFTYCSICRVDCKFVRNNKNWH